MSKIIYSIFFLLFIIGCTRPNTNIDISAGVDIPKRSDMDIPGHLQEVENLTVYSSDLEPVYSIELIRDQIFRDTDDVPIGEINGIAVDDIGRIFLIDGSQITIHVFQPNGSYLTSIGNEGRGPGEFSRFQLNSPIFTDSNQLYVFDSNLLRINIFSLETLLNSQTIAIDPESLLRLDKSQNSAPMLQSVRDDSLFVMKLEEWPNEERERYTRYYLINSSGNIARQEKELFIGKIGPNVPIRPMMSFPMFFTRRTLVDMSPEDHIYSAWSDEFLVEVRDPAGNYIRSFYYPYSNRKLSREAAVEQVGESSRSAVRNFDALPDTWPALNSLQVDDENRIWIATITEDDETYDWWVLSETGELLAQFSWPRLSTRFDGERQFHVIKNGYLYTREIDEIDEMNHIVRYRIKLTEN